MKPIIILICCVLFIVLLLYFILKSIKYKEEVDTWKDISKTQNELIDHLRDKNSIQEDIIGSYEKIAKYDQSIIDVQKQCINELLEILKTQK